MSGNNRELREFEKAAGDGDYAKVSEMGRECLSLMNAKNSEGKTALMIACFEGQVSVCKLLLSLGANVTEKDPFGLTARDSANAYARSTGNDDIVKVLGGGTAASVPPPPPNVVPVSGARPYPSFPSPPPPPPPPPPPSTGRKKDWGEMPAVRGDISAAVARGQCTFSATQKNYVRQPWFECETCGLVDNEGVCATCVQRCHANHKIRPAMRTSTFYCDCGVNGCTSMEIDPWFKSEIVIPAEQPAPPPPRAPTSVGNKRKMKR